MKNPEEIEELRVFLEEQGFRELKIVPGRGICGIFPYMYTNAIVWGIDRTGYRGRWCYPHAKVMDLVLAYKVWDGKGDPMGGWVKYKGDVEYSNPNFAENEQDN